MFLTLKLSSISSIQFQLSKLNENLFLDLDMTFGLIFPKKGSDTGIWIYQLNPKLSKVI